MLFNSFDFAIFLPIVFTLYWLSRKSVKLQNLVIVISSYVFYGWWDWRYLFLFILSITTAYITGRWMDTVEDRRQRLWILLSCIILNFGILGYYKYANFFVANFVDVVRFFGMSLSVDRLNVILPVGISFYTFQAMGYTIDVYRRDLKAAHNYIEFSAFISFFPQLVAGPIERAANLLPQFKTARHFNGEEASDGMRQILWGLFKKVVVADNAAVVVNAVFANVGAQSGSTLALGIVLFAFQIYGDFSGYSDMAVGVGKLFGITLMKNFATPYFSRDIAEFWRRWHISLSTWFRDYVYIPMGGNRKGYARTVVNTMVLFLVSGLWHGANWTFVAWGAANALLFLPLVLRRQNRKHLDIVAKGKLLPNVRELGEMLLTFTLSTLAWVFFRAVSIQQALQYFKGLFSLSFFQLPSLTLDLGVAIFAITVLVVVEWLGREGSYALERVGHVQSRPVRWAIYYAVLSLVIAFGVSSQAFVYFQF
jgi:D-alanyl-lipoteichoic acid acyltransferase DltB (MBOAT superfamily)